MSPAASGPLRIATNPWLENATLNAVMERMRFFDRFGATVRLVEAEGVAGPFDAVESGAADLCMISGYGGTLPRIAAGAPVRIVGAAMRKPALAVLGDPSIAGLADLAGRSLAVGPPRGLLHTIMLQALRQAGVPPERIDWQHIGSNADCFQAAARGEVDACCASVANLAAPGRLRLVPGARVWELLPRATFQSAFASQDALSTRRPELRAAMAAYGALFAFLMDPGSQGAFMDARAKAQLRFDPDSAQAVWQFIQETRPYAPVLDLDEARLADMQTPLVDSGMLDAALPAQHIADMSIAREATALLAETDGPMSETDMGGAA